MVLKDVHDALDEIPEEFQKLYTEKEGKFELTGIQGVKTSKDVERVTESLRRQTDIHKETKVKLATWGDLSHEDVVKQLDRIPELEAAAGDKLDEAKIEEIVSKRVEGTLKSKLLAPEREIGVLTKERDELLESNGKYVKADRTRRVHDKVRKALTEAKVLQDAHEDALLLADTVFEIREDDGAIVTRADVAGVSQGIDAAGWLIELQGSRRHWWGESVGGGSTGAGGGRLASVGGKNPWTSENWSMTEQARVFKQYGRDRCDQMAKAAGTEFGGLQPLPKAAAR